MTGSQFAEVRNALNLTQHKAADLTGYTRGAISRWETLRDEPVPDHAERYILLLAYLRARARGESRGPEYQALRAVSPALVAVVTRSEK